MEHTILNLIKKYNFNPLSAEIEEDLFVATVEITCFLKNKKSVRGEERKFVDSIVKKIRCEESSGAVMESLLKLCSVDDLRHLYNEHFKKSFNLVMMIAAHVISRKFADVLQEIVYHWSMVGSKYHFFSAPKRTFLY